MAVHAGSRVGWALALLKASQAVAASHRQGRRFLEGVQVFMRVVR